MPKSSETTKKGRVKVKDLSSPEKKLSGKDLKKVKGGELRSQSDAQKSISYLYIKL